MLICEEKQQKQHGNSAHDCLVQTQYEFPKVLRQWIKCSDALFLYETKYIFIVCFYGAQVKLICFPLKVYVLIVFFS